MGEVVKMTPKTFRFPVLQVWHNGDKYNVIKGNFYYRDQRGSLQGPFINRLTAQLDLLESLSGPNVPMRTAFCVDHQWWWKRDGRNPGIIGPFLSEKECIQAIHRYEQNLKEMIND